MNKRLKTIFALVTLLSIVFTSNACALKNYPKPIEKQQPAIPTPIATTNRLEWSNVEECKLKNTIIDDKDRLGFPINSQHPSALGNRKAITLFADFANYPSDKNHKKNMLEVQTPMAEKFWYDSSYGKYSIKFDHVDKVYHFGNHFDYISNGFMMGNKFINDVMSAADNDIDFSQYDFVNIVTPTQYVYDSGSYGMRGTYDGKSFYYALLGTAGIAKTNEYEAWLTHEIGHIVGMIHAANDWSPYIWDASVNAVAKAPDLYSWNKFLLGWMDDSQVDCIANINKDKTFHKVSVLGINSKETKMVVVKLSANLAIVIENRTKNIIDSRLNPVEEGILVYTVDISKTGGNASNASIVIFDANRTYGIGTMKVGNSVNVQNHKVEVLQKQKSGYVISISKNYSLLK